MPKCYQLIGIPGSGKSTWARSQDWVDDCAYISTDKFVDAYAEKVGKTYSEVFKDYMPTAVDLMAKEVVAAREAGKDIIWDQTSTTIASRTRKFNMLPDYEHIAVVFKAPDANELIRRLNSRPGKDIPLDVIELMIKNWESPTEEEGFKDIWVAA
jgi:predicted kinase